MSGRVGKVSCLLSAVVLGVGAGCAQPPRSTIAQLDPYVGRRPPLIKPLPSPPVKRRPAVARQDHREWNPPGGIVDRWECIVIHHSAKDRSTPAGMRAYHMKVRGWDELGYHFVIGNGVRYPDGQVYVGQRWRRQMTGAHCKVPGNFYNQHGIGICLIGNFESSRPTRAQIASLAKLLSYLCGRCGIPRSKILTHGGVTGRTACPGRHFSLGPVLRQMSVRRVSAASQ
ncbi:MAG: peptidoglycan recognition family protein [Phycisphaerae bacterium]